MRDTLSGNEWEKSLVRADADIYSVIRVIDSGKLKIGLVVDDRKRLIGTVTDGDIRRAIIRGMPLDSPVHKIMNPRPLTFSDRVPREDIIAQLRARSLRDAPIVDQEGTLIGVETLDELTRPATRDTFVVLMAGGAGERLRPLTDDCPKPMLEIAGKPILETILLNFIEEGFHRFYIAVNYKAEIIKDHFQDGHRWNIDIRYLSETQKLGTAGALGLLPDKPSTSLIVMNADLLTKLNFGHFLDFHVGHDSEATMAVREYEHQVPYGVLTLNGPSILSIAEKPVQRYFVNAGLYVLEPKVLSLISPNEEIDMPSLFHRVIECGMQAMAFPVREYWLDIGQPADFHKASNDYRVIFE